MPSLAAPTGDLQCIIPKMAVFIGLRIDGMIT
jgi:hypothetical protein